MTFIILNSQNASLVNSRTSDNMVIPQEPLRLIVDVLLFNSNGVHCLRVEDV